MQRQIRHKSDFSTLLVVCMTFKLCCLGLLRDCPQLLYFILLSPSSRRQTVDRERPKKTWKRIEFGDVLITNVLLKVATGDCMLAVSCSVHFSISLVNILTVVHHKRVPLHSQEKQKKMINTIIYGPMH